MKNMKNKNIEMTVLVSGRDIAEYEKNSSYFVEGKENVEYSIRVKNRNNWRIKVVTGVDGINVVDSSQIGDSKDEIGYILEAYGEIIIRGYRVDDKTVGAFKFVGKDKAYANTEKKLENKTTGSIICRVYREKENEQDKRLKQLQDQIDGLKWKEKFPRKEYVPVPYYPPVWPKYDAPYWDHQPWISPKSYITWCGATTAGSVLKCAITANSPLANNVTYQNTCTATPESNNSANYCQVLNNSAEAANNSQNSEIDTNSFNLGSSWGGKIESKVTETAFEVGDYLGDAVIYYSDKLGLKNLGIEFKKVPKISAFPNPAPASKKYCAVPSGWSG